jgi:hypothetical protein
MKPENARAAAHDNGATFHVDSCAASDVSLANHIATAQSRCERRAGIFFDNHGAGQHVFGTRPTDAAGNVDVGSVNQSDAKVTQAAFEVLSLSIAFSRRVRWQRSISLL